MVFDMPYWVSCVIEDSNVSILRGATVVRDIRTSPPWHLPGHYIKAGEAVWILPADNLPEDSEFKWWAYPIKATASWSEDASGPYGVALTDEDVTDIKEYEQGVDYGR